MLFTHLGLFVQRIFLITRRICQIAKELNKCENEFFHQKNVLEMKVFQ
jgi:hypothetical protein